MFNIIWMYGWMDGWMRLVDGGARIGSVESDDGGDDAMDGGMSTVQL
jgi:hypothetical protein